MNKDPILQLFIGIAYYLGSLSSLKKTSFNPNLVPGISRLVSPIVRRDIRFGGRFGGRPPNKDSRLMMKDSDVKFTPHQEAILHGTLLGDGHIQKRGNSYRLKISHSLKQEGYTNWMYEQFKSLCKGTQPPTLRESGGEKSIEFYVGSSSNVDLKRYHDLYYKPYLKIVNGTERLFYRKTLTSELIRSLPKNPYVLSTLFLDDGSVRKDVYSGRIATQGFSKDECHLLQDYFLDTWDIKTSLVYHSKAKEQYTMSIPRKEFPKFIAIVKDIILGIPKMEYKLNEENRKE
jgi:hypothetical protein